MKKRYVTLIQSVTIMLLSLLVACATTQNTDIPMENSHTEKEQFYSYPEGGKPLTAISQIKLGVYKNPEADQRGWQPRGGVQVETEEGEMGITAENGWVQIPVYYKEPLELIKIKVDGRIRNVPTFGPKKGIRGGSVGGVYIAPNGTMYLSVNSCPDTYEYLKTNYGLRLSPSDKNVHPTYECHYPNE